MKRSLKLQRNKPERLPFLEEDQTVHGRFSRMAAAFPDKEALRCGGSSLTYAELDERSDHLAVTILKNLPTGVHRVGMFLQPGFHQITAILGILKAGMCYVPLDIYFPSERNEFMFHDSGCSLLLTDHYNLAQARLLAGDKPILDMDNGDKEEKGKVDGENHSEQDYCQIIYTSGSTGQPKGVVHNHRSIVHFIDRFSEDIEVTPADRFAFYYSISFSAHTMPVLTALLNGCTLSLFDLKRENFNVFASWLDAEDITITLMIPSILRQFLATLKKDQVFKKIRILLVGGETLYRSDVEKARRHLRKQAMILNLYASTEAYYARGYKIYGQTVIKSNIVPIGYAVRGVEMLIQDEEGVRKDPNKTGEIAIKSPYIALGYWNQPEQTATDFHACPGEPGQIIFRTRDMAYKQSDGCIVHVGRSDSMIKLRGYRIDLGEIENVLLQDKLVKEAAVVVKENPFGTKHLVAYVVPAGKKSPDYNYLKLAVIRMLPQYMVPSYFVEMESLPKNDIGKTQRRDLPDPEWEKARVGGEMVAPRTALEEELREIFERILEVQPISINANIMDMGADSLRLFVAFDEIEKRFGTRLNIDRILENPTIEFIANTVEKLK
ncbi:MAG: non-ribosomal peptide synthetase [Bacteroidetes bacterium]|nr:non-ribosomal peptide synthetase [Bacteroidota bacterium]